MTLRVHPEANADLTEALAWLIHKHRPNVAGRLWRLWHSGLDALEADPGRYALADDAPAGRDIRSYLLPRYGYRIVYQVTTTEVIVLAFARGRRRLGHWQSRLESTG
jgi:plasmid stabilization system protein ParE